MAKIIEVTAENKIDTRLFDSLLKEYRSAYEIQQERYEARLQERDEEIASLKKKLSEGPAHE